MPLPITAITEYTLVDLPMAPGARAARRAVTTPLYPKLATTGNWRAIFNQAMTRWRRRIRTFRAKEVIKPKGYLKAVNCAPWGFFVQSSGQVWQYCRNDFCPWCRMREVDETYHVVEKAFKAEQEKNPDVVLWSFQRTKVFPADTPELLLGKWVTRFQQESLGTSLVNKVTPGGPGVGVGTMWRIEISPVRKGWQMTGRVLVLADRDAPVIAVDKWKCKGISSPRAEKLEPVIAAYLRYPVGFLCGQPDFTAQTILFSSRFRVEKKLRFSNRSGVFRKE
jgi:hypothetical protein